MKVLMVHNRYQHVGGEDETVADEVDLLRRHGHEVTTYTLHNDAIGELSRARLAMATLWNEAASREVRRLIRARRPDVLHAHNLFPLMSPSVYYAAAAEGVGVVQSLHNYRLLCVGGMLARDGHACEICLTKAIPWPGILHACYRDRRHSSAIAAMLTLHRALGTWRRKVGAFIALTEFARAKFIQGGLPAERVMVKPNFVTTDAGVGDGSGDYALYVGRLSAEKGVGTLLPACAALQGAVPIVVVGDGPLRPPPERIPQGVTLLGRRSRAEVYALMKDARCVIVPSEVYETFGRVAVEAFSVGTPVLAARIGALAEVVTDGVTGLLFEAGNPEDLRRKLLAMLADGGALGRMRRAARQQYEEKYTPERNHRLLLQVYDRACRHAAAGRHAAAPDRQPATTP